MSILETKNKTTSDSGISKQIDENSKDVALDILQRGIYAHPVKSTIRELVSNSYDAVNEREVAKSILSGKTKVEDHFELDLKGDIYHASGWDPSYFDLNYLSDDMNSYIFYEEGPQRDTLRIKDYGVGIGKSRMVGYFQLSWSSKRTQKGAIGKWGLGSKVALSLGIESFTVISVYNGKKFKFQVYLDKIDSVMPKFGEGKMNSSIVVQVPQEKGELKDYEMFYEDTTEKNGLELQIQVKKHSKKAFFEAIESQLLYIPNVVFKHRQQGDTSYTDVDVAAKVMYKDSNIVISESTVFDKPHILLGAGDGLINYGQIDFKELELEPKRGAVGLILDINDVEVTPSRESVVWSPKTRKAVIDGYNKIVQTATNLVNTELSAEKDYLQWMKKAAGIKNSLVANSGSTNQSALQKLAGILDAGTINRIEYSHGKFTKMFVSDPKSMLGTKVLARTFTYDKYARKVERKKIQSVNSLANYNVYITEGASNKYVDRYLFERVENGTFVQIKLLAGWNLENTSNFIGNSTNAIQYDSIQVPQDIMDLYLAEELNDGVIDDDESQTVTVDANAAARLRKLEQKIIYHDAYADNPFTYSSKEIKIADIYETFKDYTVVYGSFKEREIMNYTFGKVPKQYLHNVSRSDVDNQLDAFVKNNGLSPIKKVSIILISEENVKYIKDMPNFIPISDYVIGSYKDGVLHFSDQIKTIMTMSMLYKVLKEDGALNIIPNDNYIKGSNDKINALKDFFRDTLYSYSAAGVVMSNALLNSKSFYKFYKKCIDYQMALALDPNTDVSQFIDDIDRSLPEELCDKVDHIEHVDIVNTDIIMKATKVKDLLMQFEAITNQGPNSYSQFFAEYYNKLTHLRDNKLKFSIDD